MPIFSYLSFKISKASDLYCLVQVLHNAGHLEAFPMLVGMNRNSTAFNLYGISSCA